MLYSTLIRITEPHYKQSGERMKDIWKNSVLRVIEPADRTWKNEQF